MLRHTEFGDSISLINFWLTLDERLKLMNLFAGRTMRVLMVLAAVTALAGSLAAQAPTITYNANGVFSTPAVSGNDTFKLAGEPFNINIMASASTPPTKNGAQWAEYSNLAMSGTVHTGLEPTPFNFSGNKANLELAVGNPAYDVFFLGTPIKVISLTISLLAEIKMPPGTITKPLIHPFTAPVALSPSNTMVVYTDNGANTTLTIASGTANATCPSGVTCNPTTGAVWGPQVIRAAIPSLFAKTAFFPEVTAPEPVTATITLGHHKPVVIHLD